MSMARKRRRYLKLSRYTARIARHDQAREWDAPSTVAHVPALFRVQEPFYRNGAALPYGWQVRRPEPRLLSHEPQGGWAGPPGECGVEYACGVVLDGFDSIAAAEQVGCGHRIAGGAR